MFVDDAAHQYFGLVSFRQFLLNCGQYITNRHAVLFSCTGMYEGATGKVVWTSATSPAGIYTFEITLWPHKKRSYTPEYVAASALGMPDDMPDRSRR